MNHSGVPNFSPHRQHSTLVKLGTAIRHARIERGIAQEQLALMAEVDRSYVGRIERGDNNIAILTLEKLAHAMDMSIAELVAQADI